MLQLAQGGYDQRSPGTSAPRVMFYCDDGNGFGDLRRTVALARHLGSQFPAMRQLIVTGTLAPELSLPVGADLIKLPTIAKPNSDAYVARVLPMPFSEVLELRRDMIFTAARYFRPDLFIVDHTPPGLKEELLPTLRFLKESAGDAKVVLGLRDVLDEPDAVRQAWARDGVYGLLERYFDLVVVYGYAELFDLPREYGFPTTLAAKTRSVGYLRRDPGPQPADSLRAELNLRTGRLVMVTPGEGEDSYDLFRTALDMARLQGPEPDFDLLIVGGPPLSDAHRRSLSRLLPGVRFIKFAEDLRSYLAAADVVISRAGYNTVCEILSYQRPAVVVPRSGPGQEEVLRARALAAAGVAHVVHADELSAAHLLTATQSVLRRTGSWPSLALDGLPLVANLMDRLCRPPTPSPVSVAARVSYQPLRRALALA